MSQDISIDESGKILVLPTPVDRVVYGPVPTETISNGTIEIPPFNVTDTWLGASRCLLQFNFTMPQPISILDLPNPWPNDTFLLCIRWPLFGSTIYRYKLRSNIGEILYYLEYDGQVIPTSFCIEVWSVFGQVTMHLDTPLLIDESILHKNRKPCRDGYGSNVIDAIGALCDRFAPLPFNGTAGWLDYSTCSPFVGGVPPTNPPLPYVITYEATNITTNSARLNGNITTNGLTANTYFRYGIENINTATPDTDFGSVSGDYFYDIVGLTSGTTYEFEIVAYNVNGVDVGGLLEFTTLSDPPSIPNLANWLRSDTHVSTDTAGTIPAGNGDIVRFWGDLSGNGVNIYRYANEGIVFNTAQLDGFGAVNVNNPNQAMFTDNGFAFNGDTTIIFVARFSGNTLSFIQFDEFGGHVKGTSISSSHIRIDDGFTTITGDILPVGNFCIITMCFSVTSGASFVQLNSNAKVSGNLQAIVNGVFFLNNASANAIDFIELVQYRRALLDTEIDEVIAYFRNRYPSIP